MNGNIKRSEWVVATFLGCLLLSAPAQAASFDCAKAGTNVEHMICDNPELSKLDDELNESYKAALKDKSQVVSIKQVQKQWVKVRNSCPDTGCVESAYQKRIVQLRPVQTAQKIPLETNSTGAVEAHETACLAPKIDWRNYEWTIITGKGEAICKEMLAYVKSRPNDIAPPTCPEERLPKNGNWSRPEFHILNEAEKQHILAGIPERFRQVPNGPVSYERKIRESKLLRVVKGDISGDGVPELLLAIGGDPDKQGICEHSKRCARSEEIFEGGIVLFSDSYELLPMNDDGRDVNWAHRLMVTVPFLWLGDLIYYNNAPYWLSDVSWSQNIEDNFTRTTSRPDDPYSKMFGIYGLGHAVIGQYGGPQRSAPFIEVQNLRGEGASCEFGYFHRENLKQNSIRKGK